MSTYFKQITSSMYPWTSNCEAPRAPFPTKKENTRRTILIVMLGNYHVLAYKTTKSEKKRQNIYSIKKEMRTRCSRVLILVWGKILGQASYKRSHVSDYNSSILPGELLIQSERGGNEGMLCKLSLYPASWHLYRRGVNLVRRASIWSFSWGKCVIKHRSWVNHVIKYIR